VEKTVNTMHLIYLFAAQFGIVYFLGLQSLSVNANMRLLAMFNSTVIGVASLVLYKTVPNLQDPLEIALFLVAGPLAIMCAMMTHGSIKGWLNRRKKPSVVYDNLAEARGLVEPVYPHDGPQVRVGHRCNGPY
jgi:hypothetical protein